MRFGLKRFAALGELHYGRKETQPPGPQIKQFYDQARDELKHPLLTLDDEDIKVVANSFAKVIEECRYTCYACAIMPDHVHVLIRKHREQAEAMIESLQEVTRDSLIAAGKRASSHPVWGGDGWKVFPYTQADFVRVIEYIRQNPIKAKRPTQHWSFVKKYDGWMPGYF